MFKYSSAKPYCLVKNCQGFSLIEMVIIVAIIGILSAVAIPNMIGWRGEAQLSGAARNFYSDMQLARLKAIREAEDISILIDPLNNSYSIFIDSNSDSIHDAGEAMVVSKDMKSGINIVSTTFAGDRTQFDSRGRPNITGRVTFQNISGTVIEVSLNPIGRIRIEI
ncbi:MAG: prepilin-type N-terminal cleavage/methylation domain-containing protein [Desulfobulbaceae bacterium]|nr:prepilin-type N-terminal cleavage/methylation domain-containing protein [Desulfobulbaceae bacterium]